MNNLDKYKKFDPLKDIPSDIPNSKGNYIIVLKPKCKLPEIGITFCSKTIDNKEVIYLGISNKSLRSRYFKQHFNGTAGNSTLRKSIGSMFGWKKIPRDKVVNGKTKFNEVDENKLSEWMQYNLEFYYYPNLIPGKNESDLINLLNPPLNLSKNKNLENLEFREKLSRLRKVK